MTSVVVVVACRVVVSSVLTSTLTLPYSSCSHNHFSSTSSPCRRRRRRRRLVRLDSTFLTCSFLTTRRPSSSSWCRVVLSSSCPSRLRRLVTHTTTACKPPHGGYEPKLRFGGVVSYQPKLGAVVFCSLHLLLITNFHFSVLTWRAAS